MDPKYDTQETVIKTSYRMTAMNVLLLRNIPVFDNIDSVPIQVLGKANCGDDMTLNKDVKTLYLFHSSISY